MNDQVNLTAGQRISEHSAQQATNELEPQLIPASTISEEELFAEQAFSSANFSSTTHAEQAIENAYQPSRWRGVKRLLAWLALLLIVVETVLAIKTGFTQSYFLGGLYSAVAGLALLLILRFFWREARYLRRLKVNKHHQQQASRLLASEQVGEALPWLESVNKTNAITGFDTFKQQVAAHHSDKEVMQLYRDTVLVTQDKQAKKLINRYALESGLLVALSPLAVVDMLAVLWRGLKLVDEIATLYGLGLGYGARLRLYRSLIKQMLFVGTTELMADLSASAFSSKLVGVLSTRGAQGVSAGLLTARMGYKAMELCRPLPKLTQRNRWLGESAKSLVNRLSDKKAQTNQAD